MKKLSSSPRRLFVIGFVLYALFGSAPEILAEQSPTGAEAPRALSAALYNIGNPSFRDVWVDALNGNDANSGATPATAFRTLTRAWDTVPLTHPLTLGVRINLQPGVYTAAMIPNYWEARYGTFAAPIMIRGNGSARSQVVLQNTVNMYDVHYVYFENLSIVLGGDTFHCEKCNHLLLRNITFNGGARQQAQETIKINQSRYVYIENNDISGAWDNAIDFVAVQYGHIVKNRIHNAGDWCAYAKGGSAYLRVDSNVFYDCGTGGFTAGQGTGFQFMTLPWIQYEAYDIKVINNVIHDVDGAGLGVNGGYNILMAYNTLYRVGSRDHVFESVFGSRSCDGFPGDPGRARCQQYLNQGGWGTTVVDDGDNHIRIPNKNVFVYNNVIYNPAGFQSLWQHFAIYDPYANPPDSHIPRAVTDANLQIEGNVIWNGSASMPLGIEGTQACKNTNPTCNEAQLRADNRINTVQPQFLSPLAENFHPAGAWKASAPPATIPNFAWNLTGVPAGNNSNSVAADFENVSRSAGNAVGAYITTVATTTVNFGSVAAQDGWVLESAENSNTGGSVNGTGDIFIGDDAARKQYRGVLSFNTGAALPDNAVITKAVLRIRRSGVVGGGNPLNAFQGFRVDVRKGSFGDAALAGGDFQAAANKSVGPFAPALTNSWYVLDLTGAAAYVNKAATGAGLTQIRLRFSLDDDNNSLANQVRFYSGNSTMVAYRPLLTVEYYVP